VRGEIKKRNVIFVPLNVSLIRDSLQSFFFFGFTEVVCVYIHYRSVCVCVCVLYYCLSHSIHVGYITRCVCFIIIYSIIYIQTKLLQCYYREILNIQTHLCDVQGPGDDDLGSPESLL
jgi:hypothetical protein